MEMEIDSPQQSLAEKFEKTLRMEDDDDYVFVDKEAEESSSEESSSEESLSSSSSSSEEEESSEKEEEPQRPQQKQQQKQQQVPRDYNPIFAIWYEPEERPEYTYQQLCFEITDKVAKDFIHQLHENRFGEFPWPPDLNWPLYQWGYISRFAIELEPEAVESMLLKYSVKSTPEEVKRAKRFLELIRSSWGYDLDCIPPRWLGCVLRPIELENEAEAEEAAQAEEAACWAINKVNNMAVKMGKNGNMLELKCLDKAVRGRFSVYLVSFTVKDVLGDATKKVRATVGFAPSAPAPALMECKLVP